MADSRDHRDKFSTQFGLLFAASDVSNSQLTRAAARLRPTPLKLSAASLSEWSSGTSIPSDPVKFRFVIEHLEQRIRAGSGRRPLGHAMWEAMRLQAQNQRRANAGGRPRRERLSALAGNRLPAPPRTDRRIDLRVKAAPIESVVDPDTHYAPWAEDQRTELLEGCEPPTGFASNDIAHIFRTINVARFDPWSVPDRRTVEAYTTEVDDYLTKAVAVLAGRAWHDQSRHEPAMLAVTLVNNTDLNILDIQLDISIPDVTTYTDRRASEPGDQRPALPRPPRPFGTPTVGDQVIPPVEGFAIT